MASLFLLSPPPFLSRSHRGSRIYCLSGPSSTPARLTATGTRRQGLLLLLLSSAATLPTAVARAEDIPLFGLRKKLKKFEEEAEVIVKEGEKAVEGGIEAAEKEIAVAEKEVEAAEAGLEAGLGSGGGLVQAAAVAAAETVGVLVAVSVVNGILGPEAQKS